MVIGMSEKNKTPGSKMSYVEFLKYMKRYEKENKRQSIKEKHSNPYTYKRVFKKDNINES